jgi:hypothetical protein
LFVMSDLVRGADDPPGFGTIVAQTAQLGSVHGNQRRPDRAGRQAE